MSKSFVMILNSRYPTEKAYGVTTSNTAEALHRQGYWVEIWAPSNENGQSIPFLTKNLISKKTGVIIEKVNKFNEWAGFKFQFLICLGLAVVSSRKLQRESIYWVRDPYLCLGLLLLTRRLPIIFEMHFPINKFTMRLMLLGIRRNRVLIGALTENHRQSLDLGENPAGTFILPMAASDNFFEVGRNRQEEITDIPVIGFLGKATSSGNDNGLTDFLMNVSLAQDRGMKVRFWFAGIEEHHKTRLLQKAKELGIREDFLKVTGHVNHEFIPDLLSKFDFGLMPYKESIYNSYRFPIKSVEYAASKVIILATNTVSHRQILDSSRAVFYEESNPLDFVIKLEELIEHPEQRQILRKGAATWALNYTYYNRVKLTSDALKYLEKLE